MKRIIAIAAVLALALSMFTYLPVSAATASPLAGKSHVHDGIEFQEWSEASRLPDTAGNYCLTVDVPVSSRWMVPEGEVNLCLNGHSIIGDKDLFVAVHVDYNSVLKIYDCSEGEVGTIRAKYTIENWYGTVIVNSGNIEGSSYGIHNTRGGTVTVNGGTVFGNSYGIYNHDDQYMESGCKVTVNGGSITGNAFGIYNHNDRDKSVYSGVEVTVNGGVIDGMTNGIRNQYGTVTVNGGTITAFDYGVYNMGIFSLSGNADISAFGSDIFLFRKYITITGKLENEKPYVVSILDFPEEGDGMFTNTESANFQYNDPKRFTASDELLEQGYTVIKTNGQLRIGIAPDEYTITYNPGEGIDGESFTDIKTKGTDLKLSDKIYTRMGYEQIGWATSDGGEKVYDLGGIYADDSDLTLYPAWKANTYKIIYHDGDDVTEGSYAYDEGLVLPVPTKIGYCFIGWYEDEDFSGETVTEIGKTEMGDREFWAKWVDHEHKWNEDVWAHDTEAHWHECTADGCDILENSQKDGYGEHQFGEDEICSVCGARPYLPGDLNGDGFIDSIDSVLLLRYLVGIKDPGIIEEAADFNQDGEVDTLDSVLLLRYLVGID